MYLVFLWGPYQPLMDQVKKLNELLLMWHTFSSMFPWRLLCVSSPHSGTWQAPLPLASAECHEYPQDEDCC